jgi:AcrR family transcriptional regulator
MSGRAGSKGAGPGPGSGQDARTEPGSKGAGPGPGSAGDTRTEPGAPTGSAGRRRGRPPKQMAGDTKEALLEAALTLFATRGYEGTSVRAISRAAGLSDSGLYAHFGSKRALFEAALARLGPTGMVAAIDTAHQALAGPDPAAFVRALVGRLVDDWSAAQSRQLVSLVARDGLIHDPALTGGIHIAVRALARHFRRWIEAGQLRDDMGSPEDLAYALIGPMALTRVLWLHDGAQDPDIDGARERVMRHAEFFVQAVFG